MRDVLLIGTGSFMTHTITGAIYGDWLLCSVALLATVACAAYAKCLRPKNETGSEFPPSSNS